MKLYVVTKCEYSDYRIVAIYDNKKAAKIHANSFCEHQVEEYELNPKVNLNLKSGYKFFFVEMFRGGGLVKDSYYAGVWQVDDKEYVDDYFGYYCIEQEEDVPVLHTIVQAKNEKHAVEIVDKIRLELIKNSLFFYDKKDDGRKKIKEQKI